MAKESSVHEGWVGVLSIQLWNPPRLSRVVERLGEKLGEDQIFKTLLPGSPCGCLILTAKVGNQYHSGHPNANRHEER